jgi:hypothetical protein
MAKPQPRARDLTLGELMEMEARGEPLPPEVEVALAPLTRLLRDIKRTLRWVELPAFEAPGPDGAAGMRALAQITMGLHNGTLFDPPPSQSRPTRPTGQRSCGQSVT